MIADNQYTRMTKSHEIIGNKVNLKPYKDSLGKPTIGIGHRFQKGEPRKNWTLAKANNQYSKDYISAEDRAAMIVGPKYDALKPEHQAILNDMSFQLGNKLGDFSNMLDAIDNDKLDEVSGHMLDSAWAKQTPERAQDLANRWDAALTSETPIEK